MFLLRNSKRIVNLGCFSSISTSTTNSLFSTIKVGDGSKVARKKETKNSIIQEMGQEDDNGMGMNMNKQPGDENIFETREEEGELTFDYMVSYRDDVLFITSKGQ